MSRHSLRPCLAAALSAAAVLALSAAADADALRRTARQRLEAIAGARTNRTLLAFAQLGPHIGARQTVDAAGKMVPKAVSSRVRLLAMDAETVPGHCVYTYAQGAKTWCVTNELKAVEFKAVKNRYSKLKIVVAAKAAGKWDALKAGIAAAGLEDEWAACQYIEDGDPAFVSATNAVVAAGIATAEEIAAFLKLAIDN